MNLCDVIKHLQTTRNSVHFNKHSNNIKQIFFNIKILCTSNTQ